MAGLSVYNQISQFQTLEMEPFKGCTILCVMWEKEYLKDQIKWKQVNFQKYNKATKFDAFNNFCFLIKFIEID